MILQVGLSTLTSMQAVISISPTGSHAVSASILHWMDAGADWKPILSQAWRLEHSL